MKHSVPAVDPPSTRCYRFQVVIKILFINHHSCPDSLWIVYTCTALPGRALKMKVSNTCIIQYDNVPFTYMFGRHMCCLKYLVCICES